MLSAMVLDCSHSECYCCAESRYVKCHYSDWYAQYHRTGHGYAECHFAECRGAICGPTLSWCK